jgi:hypothetical protein
MSKGIGHLQREILTHLEDPISAKTGQRDDGEVTVYGCGFVPANGVYDLRHVFKCLEVLHNRTDPDWNKAVFQAAFSRAVRSLVRRGILEALWLIPIVRVCFYWRKDCRFQVECLNDGSYVRWHSRQVRFVRRNHGSLHV